MFQLFLVSLIFLSNSSRLRRRILSDEGYSDGYGYANGVWSKSSSSDSSDNYQYVKAVVNCQPGQIDMWYGHKAGIPHGWRICDGSKKTPDLRDRFVIGAGDKYPYWSYGGWNKIKLTVEQLPKHKHAIWEKDIKVSMNGWHKHDASGTAQQGGWHKHEAGTLKAQKNGAHSHEFWASSDSPDGGHEHKKFNLDNSYDPGHSHEIELDTMEAGSHSHADTLRIEEGGAHGHTIIVNVDAPKDHYPNKLEMDDVEIDIPDHSHGVGDYAISPITDTHSHYIKNGQTDVSDPHKHEINVMTDEDGGHGHDFDLYTDESEGHTHGSGTLVTKGNGTHSHMVDDIMIDITDKYPSYGDSSNSGYGYGGDASYPEPEATSDYAGGSWTSDSDYGVPGYYECAWNTAPENCQVGIALDKVDISHKWMIDIPTPPEKEYTIPEHSTDSAGWHTHDMWGNTAKNGKHSHSIWGTIKSDQQADKHMHQISGKWTEEDGEHSHDVTGETDEYELNIQPTLSGNSGAGGAYSESIPVNGQVWGGDHTHPATAWTSGDKDDGEHGHELSGNIENNGTHTHKIMGWTKPVDGHTHDITGTIGAEDDGKHEHSFKGATDEEPDHGHDIEGYTATDGGHSHELEIDIEYEGNHDHQVNGDTATVGEGEYIDITPPYFSVYFICCVIDDSGSWSYSDSDSKDGYDTGYGYTGDQYKAEDQYPSDQYPGDTGGYPADDYPTKK